LNKNFDRFYEKRDLSFEDVLFGNFDYLKKCDYI